MKALFIGLLLCLPLLADKLQLEDGSIHAHARMIMDSNINPLNTKLGADIEMANDSIESLKGEFFVTLSLFKSDKEDRDEHMYEALEILTYKDAIYKIKSVTPTEKANSYVVDGVLNFHGQEKPLQAKATITSSTTGLNFQAKTSINMPDYGVEMPCLLFMCVEDKVDLNIKAQFLK